MPLSRVSPGIALFEASITFPLHLQQQEWKSIYITNDDVDLTILVIELWQQDVFTSITVCIAWWEWLVFDQKQTHPMSRFCFHCFLLRCIRPSVGNTFVFPFCQRLWDLTKRHCGGRHGGGHGGRHGGAHGGRHGGGQGGGHGSRHGGQQLVLIFFCFNVFVLF